eukprot:jgi/Ulvmu1/11312/UM074_0027.1
MHHDNSRAALRSHKSNVLFKPSPSIDLHSAAEGQTLREWRIGESYSKLRRMGDSEALPQSLKLLDHLSTSGTKLRRQLCVAVATISRQIAAEQQRAFSPDLDSRFHQRRPHRTDMCWSAICNRWGGRSMRLVPMRLVPVHVSSYISRPKTARVDWKSLSLASAGNLQQHRKRTSRNLPSCT